MFRITKKNKRGKKILSQALAAVVALSSVQMPVSAQAWDPKEFQETYKLRFWKNEQPGVRFYINAAAKYILEDQKKQSESTGNTYPTVGSTFGEWSVWDLLRGMYTGADYINEIPENYFEDYLQRVETYVEGKNGVLHTAKSTEWSRLMLPLTALGYDITSVADYDFIEKLSQSFAFSYRQGINGPIWEIISMNAGNYAFVETEDPETANTFGKMLDYILDYEIIDEKGVQGGWALSGNAPDTDVTGMALTAFAPYYLDEAKYQETGAEHSYEEFAAAVERGILALSKMQQPNGGFASWGTVNSESTVWAMIPLLEMQIDPKAENIELPHIEESCSFLQEGAYCDGVYTDNMVDALLTFWAGGSGSTASVGGFKHVTAGYDGGGGAGTSVNAMATDQALYGLIAYDRFVNGEASLFQLQDQMNGEYKTAEAVNYTITYEGQEHGDTFQVTASPYAEVLLSEGKVTDTEMLLTEWNTEADGSGITYYPDEILSMPEQDITLYAQYGEPSYCLHLELNGGTLADGVTIKDNYSPKEQILLPTAEEITKEGCRFDGWYTTASFTGSKVTEIPMHSYGDKTFYAKWSVISDKANQFYAIMNRLSGHTTTISDQEDIEKARALYDAMLPAERERITASVYNSFLKKEEELKKLLASMDQAGRVSALIAALDKELTLQEAEQVQRAREAYDALTEEEKALIENLSILTAAEAQIAVLQENKQKADVVIAQIEAIQEVTLESKEVIAEARTAFQALTEAQKALIPSHIKKILENAEKKLTELLEQKDRMEAFLNCVERIPEQVSIEDDSLQLVMQAHAAWLKLNETERAELDAAYMNKITEKERELLELAQEKMTEEDYEAAQNMELRIAGAGGKVTLESEETLQQIRRDFDAMNNVRQALVSNYYALVSLEMDLETLKKDAAAAEAISERIAGLGEITFESEEQVTQIRKDYGLLSAAQKALVENYTLLVEAENKLADMKFNKSQADAAAEKIQQIGEVSLKSRDTITKARAAYDALSEKQKAYLSDEIVKVLTDAETEYARLEALVLRKISLDKTEVHIIKGEQETIQVFYDPEDTISDKTVQWSSADPNVAKVENGMITAAGGGETVVTAHVGTLTADCIVKVEVPLEKLEFTETEITLKKGSSQILKFRLYPEDQNQDVKILFESNAPDTVSVDEAGQIRARQAGSAVITAYCEKQPQIRTEIKVTVLAETVTAPTDPEQNIQISVKKVNFTSLKASKGKKAILKWKKIKGVSGYEISYAVGKKKNWKTVSAKKTAVTKTVKKLKAGKKYFFKIRAYKTVGGKRYGGEYSKIRSVKIKK